MSKADEMFEEIGNKINELVQAVKQLDLKINKQEEITYDTKDSNKK